MIYSDAQALSADLEKVFKDNAVTDSALLTSTVIDNLIHTAVFGEADLKSEARTHIREIAKSMNVNSSSIHNVYMAIGEGAIKPTFTVPAINVRFMTYDMAQIIFKLMMEHNIGPVVFEIARSEIEYTDQRPDEYAVSVLAGAIKAGYTGPVFLQGDHFQFSQKRFKEDAETEKGKIKKLVKESLDADFQNIDIDASTLVDLALPTLQEQQETNFMVTAELTNYIRSIEKTHTSIGAEIGHIGGKNSTPEDLTAFMEGYRKQIPDKNTGISKISVQTGSSHGGIPLPDGTIADVKIDFTVIEKAGAEARSKFQIGGVVQHGASTLPADLFSEFPKNNTLEIHLATGFQNIVYDNLPQTLKDEMFAWLDQNHQPEWDDTLTHEQNIYKTRKRAIGPFKKQCWMLSEGDKAPIIEGLKKQLSFLFEQLQVANSRDIILKYV